MVENSQKSEQKNLRPRAKAGRSVASRDGAPDVAGMVESIVGCKWSLYVLAQIRRGVNRPGALVRNSAGLSTKVLNERLAKMHRFGILEKLTFPEIPPHVEYRLTPFGRKFVRILAQVEKLERELAAQPASVSRRPVEVPPQRLAATAPRPSLAPPRPNAAMKRSAEASRQEG
jgi:DNA-binding HxlR family transcriptional regulator